MGSGSLFLLSPSTSSSTAAEAASRPVVSRSGTMTVRPAGQPTSSALAHQVKSAKVTLRVKEDRTQATVALRAVPTSAQNASLRLFVGQVEGSACVARYGYSTPTHGSAAPGWTKSGATYTLDAATQSIYSAYDCAFAAVTELDGSETWHDILGGSLAAVYAKGKLKVVSAKLLGSTSLQLVPGVWTPIEVTVRNVGEYRAGRVLVTGRGTALSVKQTRTAATLHDGSSTTVTLRVRLNKKRKTSLRITAKGPTALTATRSFAVRSKKAPARIKDGRYRSKDKRINFRVKKARIVGFRIYTRTTCGGYPDFYQYSYNYYTVPTTAVPKSGVVTVVQKRPRFTAKLVGLASGKSLKRATFTYHGPNRCRASRTFVAHRIGK